MQREIKYKGLMLEFMLKNRIYAFDDTSIAKDFPTIYIGFAKIDEPNTIRFLVYHLNWESLYNIRDMILNRLIQDNAEEKDDEVVKI